MRIANPVSLSAASLSALLLASTLVLAQGPEPGSMPEQTAPARGQGAQSTMARPRPAVAPLNRADPNSPAQAGRNALYKYLDDIAAKDTAARRATIAKITTRAQAEARQRQVRAKIMALLGGLPEKTPLNARTTGETRVEASAQGAGFRIVKVLYDSQPNFPVTALLYLPDSQSLAAATKLPAIVMAPGHAASGKAGDYQMAATFARNGFAVLSYDPIGQGERMQYPDPAHPGQDLATRPTGEHGEAGLQPTLIGDAVARYFAWDGMRAVDYLLSRPEVDPNRIGAFGCSGGGAMTALLGALDSRVHATATACYFTTFDTLLPSIGAQDAEQSIPGFIAPGPQNLPLDFADWLEIAAPRPYAMVGTVSDMFPWAGFLATATEARHFYSLFNPAAEGTPTGAPLPPTPTGPTLNPDTSNTIAPNAPFQLITGIGGHGNLGPITSQIVSFFLVNLAHSDATPHVPPPPVRGAGFGAAPSNGLPTNALQVTPTGQVLTSYPNSATVFSLNLVHAAQKLPKLPSAIPLPRLQAAVRAVTHADAKPGTPIQPTSSANGALDDIGVQYSHVILPTDPGITLRASIAAPGPMYKGPRPAVLILGNLSDLNGPGTKDENQAGDLAHHGSLSMVFTPRPSPPGGEETKSPILGPFYMTELRAELVGKSILGMRVDDVIRAVDYLASRPDVDPNNITAEASGHMGLVLLHAAVLDPRLKHITIDHTLESYQSLLHAPMPLDAPQDILSGVLLHYDIPDLVHALGPRLTASDWLPGTANLAGAVAAPPAQP